MPKLSDQLKAERRRHVLVSAWRCFSRDGFHATSMDDVIAETGMSSSAVYRYVSGKDELIAAAADEALSLVRARLDALLGTEPVPPPARVIESLLAEIRDRMANPDFDLTRIAIQAWGEALRGNGIGSRTTGVYRQLRGRFEQLAVCWAEGGHLPRDADAAAVATAMVTLVPGLIVHLQLIDPLTAGELCAGLAALGGAVAHEI